MVNHGQQPQYDTDRVFLANNAVDEAVIQRVRVIAADRVGLVAIHEQVRGAFPKARKLQELQVPSTACVLRLAGLDPRFGEADDGIPYAYADNIGRPAGVEPPHYTSRLMVNRAYRGQVVDVTVPSIIDNAQWGAAYARGLMEYGGVIQPSDEITGDAERLRHPDPVLIAMDSAQSAHPNLFVAINGTVSWQ